MAAAALVLPARLDRPSLMLTGQSEEEVSRQSHLRLAEHDSKDDMLENLSMITMRVSIIV